MACKAQSLGPRAKFLYVHGEHFIFWEGLGFLGQGGRGGAAQSDRHGVGLVCAKRRRDTEVDERAPPRRQGLGVAEDEAGVVSGGQDVHEAGGAGLGRGAKPTVPVAPSDILN